MHAFYMVPPTNGWGNFNFEKLKLSGGRFFHMGWVASPYCGDSDNGNQKGAYSGQTNYTITFFSRKPGKVTFMVTFKEKIVVIFASLVLKGCDL